MDVKKLVGARIKELRLRKGYTQSQLAELINIDNKHLSCIELGKNMPNPQLLPKLSSVFGVEIKELFEFYHLQDQSALKKEILSILDKLNEEQIRSTYQYIRSFVM